MPHRVCLEPRCGDTAAYRGRCAGHARKRERITHPNKHIYNSAKWKRTRRRQLHDHPLCRECGVVATDVDHIQPIEQGGDVWSFTNLRSLCHSCHSRITRGAQVQS